MKKVLVMVDLLILLVILIVIYVLKGVPEVVVKKDMVLLETDYRVGDYTILQDNKMYCDLSTFSWIVSYMVKGGFVVEGINSTEQSLDVVVARDDLKVRMYYEIDGSLTSICNQYEKSYIPISYINSNRVFGGDAYGFED